MAHKVHIWKASMSDAHEGTCLGWGANKKEALAALNETVELANDSVVSYHMYEVEDSKKGISAWLNRIFTRDNG